jgi:NADPH-dependent 2,4-dienoyl-CoA reductase/sulfur reductase-like enzyme
VTVVEMGPRLIGREDPEISDAVREILEAEGVNVRLNSECISFAPLQKRASASTSPARTARRR